MVNNEVVFAKPVKSNGEIRKRKRHGLKRFTHQVENNHT